MESLLHDGVAAAKLPPSFLSVDTDGRVVRCDTFSKWVCPGLRCGWVTAPTPLIQKLAQGTGPSLGVASSVQVLLHAMLDKWGAPGLDRHVRATQPRVHHRAGSRTRDTAGREALQSRVVHAGGLALAKGTPQLEVLAQEDGHHPLEERIVVGAGKWLTRATLRDDRARRDEPLRREAAQQVVDALLVRRARVLRGGEERGDGAGPQLLQEGFALERVRALGVAAVTLLRAHGEARRLRRAATVSARGGGGIRLDALHRLCTRESRC